MRTFNSNKNKLNSKINWQKINYPNGHFFFKIFFYEGKIYINKEKETTKTHQLPESPQTTEAKLGGQQPKSKDPTKLCIVIKNFEHPVTKI